MPLTRRDFLERSTALAAAGFVPRLPEDFGQALAQTDRPATPIPEFRGRPLVVSSSNGFKGVKVAYDQMLTGTDPLGPASSAAGMFPIVTSHTSRSI